MRLDGQIAVVTGAGQGIGRATALRLARDGAAVVVMDRNEETARASAEAIRGLGRRALAVTVDVTDEAAVRQAFDAARAEFGRIDILVNNAGRSARERATEFWLSTPDTWRFVLRVNILSTMLCSRQVVPEMRERRQGKIVNMSSDSALVGDRGMADYVAAKAAIIGFTRSLARELAPFQVNVNVVCPGAIRTAAHETLPPAIIDQVRNNIPMGYVAEPEDVAHAVAFLVSEEARYITGATLVIDGGRFMP